VNERRQVGALQFSVRDRGIQALSEPINAARLERPDAFERQAVYEEITMIIRERREERDAPLPPPVSLRRRMR
jgi:hypothetical protein